MWKESTLYDTTVRSLFTKTYNFYQKFAICVFYKENCLYTHVHHHFFINIKSLPYFLDFSKQIDSKNVQNMYKCMKLSMIGISILYCVKFYWSYTHTNKNVTILIQVFMTCYKDICLYRFRFISYIQIYFFFLKKGYVSSRHK